MHWVAEIRLLVVPGEMGVSAGLLQKKNTQFWVLASCLLQGQGVSLPERTHCIYGARKASTDSLFKCSQHCQCHSVP